MYEIESKLKFYLVAIATIFYINFGNCIWLGRQNSTDILFYQIQYYIHNPKKIQYKFIKHPRASYLTFSTTFLLINLIFISNERIINCYNSSALFRKKL